MNIPVFFQIFAGLLFILFLVALVMGFKSWRVHTVMMALLVFLTTVCLLVLSGMALQAHSAWRTILEGPAGQREEGLIYQTESLERENRELRDGKLDASGDLVQAGIEQRARELRHAMYDRGRVWRDCKPGSMAGGTSVQVQIPAPQPARIRANSTLFVFDAKPVAEGGRYLGEFKVTSVVDPALVEGEEEAAAPPPAGGPPATVTLELVWTLTEQELQQLGVSANRGGPWTLYEKMPADAHTLFEDLTDEELGQLLPERVLEEYRKDHQEPAEDDPPERIELYVRFNEDYQAEGPDQESFAYEKKQKVWLPQESVKDASGTTLVAGAEELASRDVVDIRDQRYSRQLRDYSLLFREIYLYRDQLVERTSILTEEIETIQEVLQDKQKVIEDFEQENQRLSKDKDGFQRDLKALSDLLAEMQAQNDEARRRVDDLRKQNASLAEKLDQKQMEAVRQLNRRTPAPQAGHHPDRAPHRRRQLAAAG